MPPTSGSPAWYWYPPRGEGRYVVACTIGCLEHRHLDLSDTRTNHAVADHRVTDSVRGITGCPLPARASLVMGKSIHCQFPLPCFCCLWDRCLLNDALNVPLAVTCCQPPATGIVATRMGSLFVTLHGRMPCFTVRLTLHLPAHLAVRVMSRLLLPAPPEEVIQGRSGPRALPGWLGCWPGRCGCGTCRLSQRRLATLGSGERCTVCSTEPSELLRVPANVGVGSAAHGRTVRLPDRGHRCASLEAKESPWVWLRVAHGVGGLRCCLPPHLAPTELSRAVPQSDPRTPPRSVPDQRRNGDCSGRRPFALPM
mmetsp:Transcript_55658/g.178587  ORF Transcript_55658/g.178587 Transcript_55658/m.178587 type:complete len:311 (-) Transcript_55658:214-1146(-)